MRQPFGKIQGKDVFFFKDFDGPKGYAYMFYWFIYENEDLTKVFFDLNADDASP